VSEETRLRRIRNKFASTWSTLIAIGAIGGLLSLVEKGWHIFVVETIPEITAPELGNDPFALPVSIKNPNPVFSMTDVWITCSTTQDSKKQFNAKIDKENGSYDSSFRGYTKKAEIPPLTTILVACPLADPKFDATITPSLEYTVLGLWRRSHDASFTWLASASPPHWRPGEALE
jgi:hypothetical protein